MGKEIKTRIMQQIFNYFVDSKDSFNGLDMSSIGDETYTWEKAISALKELIREGNVNIISDKYSPNIHIIGVIFLPIKEQINELNALNGDRNFCCYPSSQYLTIHRDISMYATLPFDKMLALGAPQLQPQYFEWDVLYKYSEDPRFDFEFRDYEGEISSTDLLPDTEHIHIQTFGTGRDSKNRKVIAVFPRYLVNMSSINQFHWYSKMVDRTNCVGLTAYVENQMYGNWDFPDSVYTAILQEMYNINQITNLIWNCIFFKKDFLDSRPKDFGTIFKPTLTRYNAFLTASEKIVPANINPDFFMKQKINKLDPNGFTKGTINLMKEWLNVVCKNKDVADEIIAPIQKIRKLRQAPAHKIEPNTYCHDYFNKQHDIALELLNSLILFRGLLLTHRKAVDFEIKYTNEEIVIP